MGVAFFDLDRTLIDCNSGRLWVQEEWRRGNIGLRQVAWAGWWLARYSLGSSRGLDRVFETGARQLEGVLEASLSARVHEWFEREVGHRLRPGALEALKRHRDQGDRLVLATSSSPYAGAAACAAYGLDDLVSTRFEVRDGRFTGRIAALAVGRSKLDQAREMAVAADLDLSRATLYTGSYTDLPFLEAVLHPVVVNPDRRLAKVAKSRRWPVVDWGKCSPV